MRACPSAGKASMAGKPRPTRIDGRQVERLSESSASRLAAHAKQGGSRTDLLLALAAGALRQAVDACAAVHACPRAAGHPLLAAAGRLVASNVLWPGAVADAASCLKDKGEALSSLWGCLTEPEPGRAVLAAS